MKDKGQLSLEVGGILAAEPKLAELFGWIKRLRELPYPQLVENLLKESGVATYYKG